MASERQMATNKKNEDVLLKRFSSRFCKIHRKIHELVLLFFIKVADLRPLRKRLCLNVNFYKISKYGFQNFQIFLTMVVGL